MAAAQKSTFAEIQRRLFNFFSRAKQEGVQDGAIHGATPGGPDDLMMTPGGPTPGGEFETPGGPTDAETKSSVFGSTTKQNEVEAKDEGSSLAALGEAGFTPF